MAAGFIGGSLQDFIFQILYLPVKKRSVNLGCQERKERQENHFPGALF